MRLNFTSTLTDLTVKEGKTALFEFELSHENVDVTWYKNEIKVHPSRTVFTSVVGRKHTLEIKEVSLDDICLIKAEAKGISTMAKLLVIGNFTFISLLHLFDQLHQFLFSPIIVSFLHNNKTFYAD